MTVTVSLNRDYKIFPIGGNMPGREWVDFWPTFIPLKSTQGIWGEMSEPPRDGDVIAADMESGRRALFVVHGMRSLDPPDFFCEASFVGYEDDNELPESEAK
jgi:hypothetical protein